jgi:hypothetical protein
MRRSRLRAVAQAEVARLRQRVNTLALQVSALNQVLTQQLVLRRME